MKNKIIIYVFFIPIIFIGIGCVESEYVQETHYSPKMQNFPETHYSPEMQNLLNFLKQDTTSELSYYPDPHRGVEYFVCTGYVRDLAKNANEYGIKMGGISLRNTMAIGAGTQYYHAMNYCIIDGQFLIIEPQSDEIFTLESLKNSDYNVYKYITIFQDAQMMTNFGKGRETIDIYIYEDYNESEIIKKFPPK